MKKVVIIGAGPGGLSAGMILGHNNFQVDIYEKKKYIGGRNSELKLGEYKFDLRPTFFLVKDILENIFQMTGRKLEDYVKLHRIEPMYRLKFSEIKYFIHIVKKKKKRWRKKYLGFFQRKWLIMEGILTKKGKNIIR
jgi:phytoene desaturase